MNMQPIFSASYLDVLLAGLTDGSLLAEYYSTSVPYPEEAILESNTIDFVGEQPKLNISDPDIDNAVKLFNHYPHLNSTQASDRRFWAYLAHVTYRDYVQDRWGPKGEVPEEMTDVERQSIVGSIRTHWFVLGRDRFLRRHTLSRLWWAVKLTTTPWEVDESLRSIVEADPYVYTRMLLENEDLYSAMMERRICKSAAVRYGILEFIRQNPEFLKKKAYGLLMKELVLASGSKRLYLLEPNRLHDTIKTLSQ